MRQSLFRDGTFMKAICMSVFLVIGAAALPHLYQYRPTLSVGSASEAAGVHRFWSDNYQGHFYTISAEEKDFIIANDSNWTYEGVAYDAYVSQASSTEPLYRFYSPVYLSHFFTKSAGERDFLIYNDPNWNYEGIAYYTLEKVLDAQPVYRFYSTALRSHFYTTSDVERTRLIEEDPNWDFEGIAFYTPQEGIDTPTPEVDPDDIIEPEPPLVPDPDTDGVTMTVRALGIVGDEEIELRLGDQVLQRWTVSTQYQNYTYVLAGGLNANFVEVHFVSEGVPERDVVIDYLRVDDEIFQTEDSAVESYGSWDVASECGVGFKQSETLNCQGGWFRYNVSGNVVQCGNDVTEIGEQCDDGNLINGDGCSAQCTTEVDPDPNAIPRNIVVRALGIVGDEEIELRIDGQALQRWTVSTQYQDYTYRLEEGLDSDFIEVHFVSVGVAEQDVIIDYLRIDDDVYQTDDASVESYGSWDFDSQCGIGFKQSETLHCQGGWFRYDVSGSNWQCGNNVPEPGEQCDDGNYDAGDGCSAQCVVEAGTPQAPADLTVAEVGDNFVSLSWTATDQVEGYEIIRDDEFLTTVQGATSYIDESVVFGSVYTYRVRSFNSGLYSPSTDVVTAVAREPDRTEPPTDKSYLPEVVQDYTIAFYDEFGGSGLNPDKWNTEFIWGSGLIINNEEQHYVNTLGDEDDFGVDPFSFTGGELVITAEPTPGSLLTRTNGQEYTSGIITSRDSFNFTHGYAEARVKIPKGQGLWPAFWLLNTQYNTGIEPEIDIMENLGQNTNRIHQTYHYFDTNDQLVSQGSHVDGSDFSADFHVYSAHWGPGFIQFYIDGVPHNRIDSGPIANENMYILANLAIGGNWPGSPNAQTIFPAEYVIDYIRVYKQ